MENKRKVKQLSGVAYKKKTPKRLYLKFKKLAT